MIKNLLYLILILLLYILSIGRDYYEVSLSPGVDLRNRIVGARLLSEGKDPYLYKWKKGDSDRLVDVNDPNTYEVNRVTIPPSLLLLLEPLSRLNYKNIRFAWFILSYFMYICIILIFCFISRRGYRIRILSAGAIFICIIPSWALHIERGQSYIIYSFILSLSYFFYKYNYIYLSKFFIVLNVWLRPNFLLFIIPEFRNEFRYRNFLEYLKNKGNKSFMLFTFAFAFISLTFISVDNFKSYSISNKSWSEYHLNNDSLVKVKDFDINSYPKYIENESIEYYKIMNSNIQDENLSIQKLLFRVFDYKLSTVHMIIIYLIFILILHFLLNKANFSGDKIYLSGFLCYIMSEYFLPVPRYHYNAVQWIFPLLIMISSKQKVKYLNSLLIIACMLTTSYAVIIPYNLSLAEVILFITTVYYIKAEKTSQVV